MTVYHAIQFTNEPIIIVVVVLLLLNSQNCVPVLIPYISHSSKTAKMEIF